MEYWFLSLKINNGEYEFYSRSVHERKADDQKFADYAEEYAYEFYDGCEDEPGCGIYHFNCGEMAVQVYNVQKITEEEYEVLNKFLYS